MALTFDSIFLAAGREPSGFAALHVNSPDGLRRSANKASAIWLYTSGTRIGSFRNEPYILSTPSGLSGRLQRD